MTDEWADLRRLLDQPRKWQGVDRRGAWIASHEYGEHVYVREVILRLLAERDRLAEDVAELRPTPEELDDLCAAISACGYASEAVERVEEWTRSKWGVESAFTTTDRARRATIDPEVTDAVQEPGPAGVPVPPQPEGRQGIRR